MILINDYFINLYEELNTLNEEASPAFELDYEKELKDLQKQDPKALEELWPKIKSICINLSRNVFHNNNTWNYQFQLMYNAYQTEKRSKELLDDSKFIKKVNESFIKETLFNRLKETTLSKDQFDNILKDTDIKLLDGKYSFNDLNHKHSILSVESLDPTRHYSGEDVIDLKSDTDETIGKYIEVKATTTVKDNPQATHTSKVVFVYKLDADRLDVFVSWAAVETTIDSLVTISKGEETTITEATDFSDKYLWVCAEENVGVKERCISVRRHPAAAIVTAFGASNSNDIKENYSMSNLLEVYDLMEWTDPQAAKTFWAAAKEGKIDEDSFEAAYRDELVKLKLWYDLMDRGVLKDKSSYGKIKKAAEENPDSWAVKALLKLWVLQFKDNAKSVRKEREEAEAAEKAKKEKELKELSEKYFPVVETKVKEIIAKVVYPVYDSINATFEEAQNKAEKIKDLSRGLADLTWIKNWNPTNKLTKENCVQYKLELNRYYSSNELYIRFTFLNFFDKKDTSLWKLLEGIQFNTENSSTRVLNSGFVFPLSEIDEGKAYEILTTCFELLAEAIQKDTTRVDTVNRAYENLVYKTEGAKKAKAAVNAGKPVDPDFIAKLLADIRKGKENAEDEYKFWSDSTDGSAGAAHHMALFRAAEEIAPYLFDCHWRSYIDTKQIAEWKPSDSDEQLKDALMTTVFSYRPNLNIEILKD